MTRELALIALSHTAHALRRTSAMEIARLSLLTIPCTIYNCADAQLSAFTPGLDSGMVRQIVVICS